MGMTIEEAIRRIDEHNYIHQRKEPRAVHITKAFDTLIAVAKKYQRIKQIIADLKSDGGAFEMSEPYWLRLISEVVEDGKVN